MRLHIDTWKEKQYRLKAWFAYRYLSRNPNFSANPEFQEFYLVLDKFFMEKYKLRTEKETREGILQLFSYESEKPIVINENEILRLISEYENNPGLLSYVEN
ncbi:MAG: hypothetical protein E7596_07685 [Ruminococcaceae bacterium]|nr:hypothetical protein [Oscillospiraceae bacterium]